MWSEYQWYLTPFKRKTAIFCAAEYLVPDKSHLPSFICQDSKKQPDFPSVLVIYLAWISVSNLPKYNHTYPLNYIIVRLLKNLANWLISFKGDKSHYFFKKEFKNRIKDSLRERKAFSVLELICCWWNTLPFLSRLETQSLGMWENGASSFLFNPLPTLVPQKPIIF